MHKFREKGDDKGHQLQEQKQFNKIRNTKYNRIYKFLGRIGLPGYVEGEERGESQKLIVRAR